MDNDVLFLIAVIMIGVSIIIGLHNEHLLYRNAAQIRRQQRQIDDLKARRP